MDVTVQVAMIGGLFALFATVLTILTNRYQEQLERRRVRHEENRWALELNNARELELHRMRLRTYPEVFAVLGRLSDYNIRQLSEEELLAAAAQLNGWGYGEAGLCMLPDTRTALLILRDRVLQLARKTMSYEEFLRGPRTDLVELMRRDLNHDWSEWRDLKPLIELNRERIERSLGGPEG